MPHILIIGTGGTIATRSGNVSLAAADLLDDLPEIAGYAQVTTEEFSRVASSTMTPDGWLRLAKHVNQRLAGNRGIDGVVVTHGTDTLEAAAYFLNLTVKSDKPVVVVGAMRSADRISADGPANLLNAVRLAADQTARGQGVLVTLNDDVFAARDVTKSHNTRVDAFGLMNGGWIGSVDSNGPRIQYRCLFPHTLDTEFDVADCRALPRVALLADYPGIERDRVSATTDFGSDGLVLRAFAGGRFSRVVDEMLEVISGRGIPVVVVPGVRGGRITDRPERPGVVWSNGQSESKAMILLALGLCRTDDCDALQRMFDCY